MMNAAPPMPFDVHRLRITAEAIDAVRLPPFAGSALRGAFGRALRHLACMTRAPSCEGCPMRRTCAWPRLFEPLVDDDAATGLPAGSTTPPPPYMLEPPPIGFVEVRKGASLVFGMRLFGPRLADIPLIIAAWERALWFGLGATRGRMQLCDVELVGDIGPCSVLTEDASRVEIPDDYQPGPRESPPVEGPEVQLSFVTPLRLQTNGRRIDQDDLTPRRLLADAVRRIRALALVAADDDAKAKVRAWPVLEWLSCADTASLRSDLRWFDWERVSTRQQQKIRLGGWLGEIRLSGLAPPLIGVIHHAVYTGLGKECAFGFGDVRMAKTPAGPKLHYAEHCA